MCKPVLPNNTIWAGPDTQPYHTSGLIHSVRIPPDVTSDQPAPCIVMVHGWSGNESVMWIFKQTLPPNVVIITPRGPITLDQGKYIWFEEENLQPNPDSLQTAVGIFDHFLTGLPHLYPVDPHRIVLMGFSQGAFICNALALIHPQKIIGVASLAGAMPLIATETSLTGLPVFIAHGINDDTIPVGAARHTRKVYANAGADVSYGEYPVGHKVNSQGMKNLKAWLNGVLPQEKG